MIDLRSDTVTQPSEAMRSIMVKAPVGDDAYGEDASVNRLQNYCKALFRVEDALFVTSGMMANRLAFLSQTQPGDEVITEYSYHVHFFDSAPMTAFGGVVMNPCRSCDGLLHVEAVQEAFDTKQRYDYFANPTLISVENTINGWAGKIFPFELLQKLYAFSRQKKVRMHLDGARLWNAHIATGVPLHDYGRYTDTLSVCFSKGLGAPYGSLLMGSKATIDKARRFRLWLGGGVHQVGMQAAAALYALNHQLDRLAEDHRLAQYFAQALQTVEGLVLTAPVETNMVQFKVEDSEKVIEACAKKGLGLFPWVPGVIRAVVHRDISAQDLDQAAFIIQTVLSEMRSSITSKRHFA
ncbi:MAG: aminotransferase class I/II-fold pyridoxal phosphate-dependent enzyme [Gammaproteobacteria bacterium]|nr:aminotransferase class I/II-fold pyridoxal phosphate-dependent enzyme [Gammaproteobacteria bacterium]